MKVCVSFLKLVGLLCYRARFVHPQSDPVPKLEPDELNTLRAGLADAVRNPDAFDDLFVLYFRLPDPYKPDPLPDDLQRRALGANLLDVSDAELVQLLTTPVWIAELRDAFVDDKGKSSRPSTGGKRSTVVGRDEPAKDESDGWPPFVPGATTPENVGTLSWLRREVADALWLVPYATNAKLVAWVLHRSETAGPRSGAGARRFFNDVAGVIRDVRAEAASAALNAGDRAGALEHTNLTAAAGAASLDTIASQASAAALLLATASRDLDRNDAEAGEVLRLAFYAAQSVEDLAHVLERPVDAIRELLADAETWVRAQGGAPVGTGAPDPAIPPVGGGKPSFFSSFFVTV